DKEKKMDLKQAQKIVAEFAEERGWHNNLPTQRGAHLVREVARVFEHTMFMEGMTIKEPVTDLEKQIGDCLFSLLSLANRLGIDIEEQLIRALDGDREKYPAKETRVKSLDSLREASKKFSIAPPEE
ncbi:MAG: hypothetical protein WBB64_12050, partial [Anaerolineales bacterium]